MSAATRDLGAGVAQGLLRRRLVQGLGQLALDGQLADPLLAYQHELQRWNRTYNLTAIRDPAEMVTRHLLDSLAVLPALSGPQALMSGCRIIDVGTGAGLPGIPLAIARPDWQLTLVDSVGKKARFLRHVQRTLGLGNIKPVEGRVEAMSAEPPHDAVISRAFASLEDFLRLTAHLVHADGVWLAMKGKLAGSELERLPRGFEVSDTKVLSVPGLDEARHLVVVRRCAAVPGSEGS